MVQQLQDQSGVFAALRNPATYGLDAGKVEVIETHAAMVFLAGAHAIKVKKAVRFPYLDFSTLEKRQAAIKRELELNLPHAPQIYLEVLPVVLQPDGQFALDGNGQVAEWALRMRRFPDEALLSHALAAGEVDEKFLDKLADEIAAYHDASPVVRDVSSAAGMQSIANRLAEAFRTASHLLPATAIERFEYLTSRHLQSCRKVLTKRTSQGFVRRCHGDLHLANIVNLDDEPVLFDAIEFNDEIATVDVLYDLAFLLMDLCHMHEPNFANRILNRYLSRSDEVADLQGLKALPLFLACRAGVRASVAITRLQQSGEHEAENAAEILSYFGQAITFLEDVPARLVAVGGHSGTGKTSVARKLATCLSLCPGAVHLRTDVERKQMFKVDETARLPAASYTKKSSNAVYERVFKKAAQVLQAGHSVIVDGVFMDPAERAATERIAEEAGAAFSGIWLEADEKVLLGRVAGRTSDASDATADIVRLQLGRDAGDIRWHRIDANGSLDDTVERARQTLRT